MDTLVVTKRSQLTDIADAIRAKTGKSDEITLNDMPNEISEIGEGDKGFCYVDIESQMPNKVEITVDISASVSVEDGGKYYTYALYNDVRLPRIPDSVLASYPYAWIRLTDEGEYQMIVSAAKWYYSSKKMYLPASTINKKYTPTNNSWESGGSWTDNGAWDINTLIWSNHDIPNGSATATEIYFNGSELVPVE